MENTKIRRKMKPRKHLTPRETHALQADILANCHESTRQPGKYVYVQGVNETTLAAKYGIHADTVAKHRKDLLGEVENGVQGAARGKSSAGTKQRLNEMQELLGAQQAVIDQLQQQIAELIKTVTEDFQKMRSWAKAHDGVTNYLSERVLRMEKEWNLPPIPNGKADTAIRLKDFETGAKP